MNHTVSRGVRLAYDDRGPRDSSVTFLCLPGWCVNRGFFDQLAERMAVANRVLSLDWSGHGDSSSPEGEYGHETLIDDALAVIEASGATTIVPVAQAHGGWVAIELRRRLGARVPAIIASSWLVLDPPPPFLGMLDALTDEARWQEARDRLFAMWTTDAPAAVADRVRREMGAYDFAMWARAARAILEEYRAHGSPLAALASLAEPPRVLHLFSQPRAPEFLAAQQRYGQDHAWFEPVRLDATSHFPPLEIPGETASEIERFTFR